MSRIRKGDTVLVIAGKDRGKTGMIESVFPQGDKVTITGINMVKKHMKKSSKFPQGGIIDKNMPIHVSNVMILDPKDQKPSRIGTKIVGKTKSRYAIKSGEMIKNTDTKKK
jgi:large subunit ribosomal protein L24